MPDKDWFAPLRAGLKDYLEASNMSQDEFARISGVAQTRISKFIRGASLEMNAVGDIARCINAKIVVEETDSTTPRIDEMADELTIALSILRDKEKPSAARMNIVEAALDRLLRGLGRRPEQQFAGRRS